MKLSELVFKTVKNTVYLDDVSFTYDRFKKGEFDDTADYGMYINNALLPINEAIARLNDLNRIPFSISNELSVDSDGIVAIPSELNVKEIIAVGNITPYGVRIVDYRPFGANQIMILNNTGFSLAYNTKLEVPYSNNGDKVRLEYKQDIKHFDNNDWYYFNDYLLEDSEIEETDYDDDKDVELKDYGINDSICNYIIEYASAKLSEDINASVSNLHINRAEAYFSNIEPCKSAFRQNVITPKYKIGC